MIRTCLAPSKVKSLQRSLLTAVIVALIGTQTIGLHHRVEHGTAHGWVDATEAVSADNDLDHEHASHEPAPVNHDCAAVDALALGDGPPAAIVASAAMAPAEARVVDATDSDPARTPLSLFHPRAPPASLS
jgi:hypothetical protein